MSPRKAAILLGAGSLVWLGVRACSNKPEIVAPPHTAGRAAPDEPGKGMEPAAAVTEGASPDTGVVIDHYSIDVSRKYGGKPPPSESAEPEPSGQGAAPSKSP